MNILNTKLYMGLYLYVKSHIQKKHRDKMSWNLNKRKGRLKSDLKEKKWRGLQLVILSMYVDIDNINKFSLFKRMHIHITHKAISSDNETTKRTHVYEPLTCFTWCQWVFNTT